MNDFSPFDCPDCDLTVKHHHPKPMTLVDAEAQFDIQPLVVTSSGDPSPEVTELLAQEGWSIVRTEWLREGGDLPQSEVAAEPTGILAALVEELAKHQGLVGARDPEFRDRPGSPLRVTFLPGRLRFIKPGATEVKPNERPPFGCCLLRWSR